MQHQERELASHQELAGEAAEDELARAAVAVGAHDNKIGSQLAGSTHQYARGMLFTGRDAARFRIEAMPSQRFGETLRRTEVGARIRAGFVGRKHEDLLRPLE